MSRTTDPAQRRAFLKRVDAWATRTGLVPTRVRIRPMKRLWALCKPDDSITFASALLDQPIAFQDLVICHELVHLRVRDHGDYFQMMLEILQPEMNATARLAPETPADVRQRSRVEECSVSYLVSGWACGAISP